MIEHKAQKVTSAFDILGKTERINPTKMMRLYKRIAVPQVEYAASVLHIIQGKGLAICLGVPATTSLKAIEVEAGVSPLDLRREELAGREWENLR